MVIMDIHGASLANIALCNPGTEVIGIGLDGMSQASNFWHLLKSLELNHVDVFLTKDERSLGATEKKLC